MNPVNQKLLELTSLSQDAFFGDSQTRFFDLQMQVNEVLAASPTPETQILWINGPQAIDISLRQELPLLVLRYASGARNWKVSTALNQYLVVQDLDTGAARFQLLAEQGEERARRPPPSGSGEPPNPNSARATGTALRRVFLRDLMKLSWQPARLAISVIEYDTLSNTLSVALSRQEAGALKSPLPTVLPSEFVTCPTPLPAARVGTSELRWSAADPSQSPTLQGQINAIVASVPVARSSAKVDRPDILRATLLVASIDRPPRMVDLAIPAVVQGEPGAAQSISANFCIDIAKLLGSQQPATVNQFYLLAGSQASGPLPSPPSRKAGAPPSR